MKKTTRREFLKGVGQCVAFAAAASIAPLVPAVPAHEPVKTIEPWHQMGIDFVLGVADGLKPFPGLRPFWPMEGYSDDEIERAYQQTRCLFGA